MKSNEFKPNILREPMDPVIVGECQNKKWITNSTLFGPMKMNNCSVNVGYLDNEPYVHAVSKQNSFEYIGIDFPILRVIANHLNFTVNLSEMEGSKNIMKTDKVARSLRSNRSYDIIIGGITWQPKDDVDYTVSYEVVQLVFLVPVQAGGVSFLALISPLDKSVWIAIMIVLSFAIFLKFIVFYKISFLEITAVIIGVAWNKQPIIFSYRILFMSWVIFGYILTQYYLASMPGRLLAKTDNKIDTIKDLIDSGISRGGLKNTKIFFIGNKKFNNKSTSNELIDKLFENYNGFERIEYEKKLQDLISGKNKTMALSALMNSSSIPTKFDSRILRILPEALTTFPLGFPVWRGLPYLNDIDKDLQILIESGIISHFGNIETKHVFSKDNNDGKISDEYIKLNDLVPGFLILGIGYAVGLIFFFFEIMISRVK
ncbi:uncharacterized protein LOC122849002 [Aphidius gifuensis]|uniref:uncharacterized protein LOC122849002 n=1 Tax=Aphidius gifuensis TaxID=684658 RepID=UPI001CDBCF9E|nr:uncharacterized protein LOC122849002 [Aphidius gifuensis]